MYLQTGDVIYKSIDKLPRLGRKKIAGNLIHKGENHHHVIQGKFALYTHGDEMFIDAKGTCQLEHEEHKTLELPKGVYKKELVNEYDHFLEESRKVID